MQRRPVTFVPRALEIAGDLRTRQQQSLPSRLPLELVRSAGVFDSRPALLGRGNLIFHGLAFPPARHDPSLLPLLYNLLRPDLEPPEAAVGGDSPYLAFRGAALELHPHRNGGSKPLVSLERRRHARFRSQGIEHHLGTEDSAVACVDPISAMRKHVFVVGSTHQRRSFGLAVLENPYIRSGVGVSSAQR